MSKINFGLIDGLNERELIENLKSANTSLSNVERINLYCQKRMEDNSQTGEHQAEFAENASLLKQLKNDLLKEYTADMEAMVPSQRSGDLRKIKQSSRLMSKICNREIDSGFKSFTNDIAKVEVAARLSEERNCPIDQITNKDIEEKLTQDKREDAERRERLYQELLLDETELEKKKQQASKHAKKSPSNIKKQQNKNSSKTKPALELPPAAVIPVKPLSRAEMRFQASVGFYKRPSIQEHPRVTKRWHTKNPEEIRNFEDTSATGERIKRYERLNDSEIRYMRACHYLPALEKIFADGRDKKIYSFRTEKGVGMAAILHCDNEKHYGFINFGIGADGTLFHRFFEKTDPSHLFQAIQRTGKELLPEAPIKDEEKWTPTSQYTFEFSEDGAIHVSYPDEEHAITIFPIRKDLLDKSLFN